MKTEDYRKHIAARPTPDPAPVLIERIPDGEDIVWMVLPVNFAQLIASGRLPLSIFKGKTADELQDVEKISKDLNPDEGIKFLELVRDVLLENVVEPKFSLTGEEEGTIPVSVIPPEHFQAFQEWLSQGGGTTGEPFRGRGPANRKKRRKKRAA